MMLGDVHLAVSLVELYPNIWCDACESPQPILHDRLPADPTIGNDHEAMDLCCRTCGLVIATLHGPAAPAREIAKMLRSDDAPRRRR